MSQDENLSQPSAPELPDSYNPGDPFAAYASDVDTSYPIIPGSLYDLEVKKAERGKTKDEQGKKIDFELATTSDTQSITGEPVPAGFVIMHNIGITPTQKYTVEMVKKALGSFLQAAGLGSLRLSDFMSNPSQAVDKIIRCKVGISKETEEFSSRNQMKSFVKV